MRSHQRTQPQIWHCGGPSEKNRRKSKPHDMCGLQHLVGTPKINDWCINTACKANRSREDGGPRPGATDQKQGFAPKSLERCLRKDPCGRRGTLRQPYDAVGSVLYIVLVYSLRKQGLAAADCGTSVRLQLVPLLHGADQPSVLHPHAHLLANDSCEWTPLQSYRAVTCSIMRM